MKEFWPASRNCVLCWYSKLMEDKPFELEYVSCSSVHVCISVYYIHLVCNELSIHLTGVTQSL